MVTMRRILLFLIGILLLTGTASAGERIDLIPAPTDGSPGELLPSYVLDAAWVTYDPWGELNTTLGAAAALNMALGLRFSGYASPEQISLERKMAETEDPGIVKCASFAARVLDRLDRDRPDSFPDAVELLPVDFSPNEPPIISPDDPHLVILRYDSEEHLERLLQKLYFKLIQGPVLLTVPYQANAESVPEEFRNWHNFRYGDDPDPNTWNEVRLVYADWDLTQTVVLSYENGKIACYDSGRKYYIDHTAAITAAGAMLAHPSIRQLTEEGPIHYLLASDDREQR